MTSTTGIDSKKYVIDDEEVNVTPGIRTVNSENSVGTTKKFVILFIKNQNANPIIMKPEITLTSAKILIPLFVRPKIFRRTEFTCLFLYTRLYALISKPNLSSRSPFATMTTTTQAIKT